MLRELRIENIAIIDRCAIEFSAGFNALTGETGAGKSIVLGALNLILGGRASADDIRTGAEWASVEAIFEPAPDGAAARWLADGDLATAEGELIVRRDISRAGRNRNFINGRSAPLAQLRELGERLVDLHGQHQHQSLLNVEAHLELLDQFGAYGALLEQTRERHQEWTAARRRLHDLETDEREVERRKDALRFQLEEIDRAKLAPDEDDELEHVLSRLRHAEKLRLAARTAHDLLYEGEIAETSVSDMLGRVAAQLDALSAIDASTRDFHQARDEIVAAVDDLAARLRDYGEAIESNPERLAWVEERWETVKRLQRKYGGSAAEVLAARKRYAEELDAFEHREERIAQAQKELHAAEERLAESSLKLSRKRRESARAFSRQLVKFLRELQMPRTQFEVRLERADANAGAPGVEVEGRRVAVDASGIDRIEFLLSPNPGEELKPLRKIASGGELSRIMLALKSMAAGRNSVPTMVFDEIDTGISGAAAERVGDKMRALGRAHQLLAITHLPQIASKALTHFVVEKQIAGKRTTVAVRRLDPRARMGELARLVGGAEITETGLRYAKELIDGAD